MTADPRDRNADRPSATREWKGDHSGEGNGLYNPSETSATRMREKGMGVGEEELRLQRDPTRAYERRESPEQEALDDRPPAPPVRERPH